MMDDKELDDLIKAATLRRDWAAAVLMTLLWVKGDGDCPFIYDPSFSYLAANQDEKEIKEIRQKTKRESSVKTSN